MSSAQSSRFRAAAKLLPRFIAHRRRDIGDIGVALARDDFETIARIGHNMRGNGDSYGFPEVSTLGARLETAANTRDRSLVADLAISLEGLIASIERNLEEGERPQSEIQVRAHDPAEPVGSDDLDPRRKNGQ
jgi:HPt (histidine-containing phosphotransfer) domain-containing protein